MRTKLMLGVVCASLSLVAGANASDLEDQAYDEGSDAAREFCQNVEEEEMERTIESREITEEFEENCKEGFDDYINSNRTCKRKLERTENGYREMWRARREACT